ncbi:MAG: hypothetical protein LHW46_08545 [Candidatus Cloacimonetes bacterium]|nr:hypothetical protein [Candidatus Cloacimonadota bacterium]
MKVQIVALETNTNTKTGEITNMIKALVPCSFFGRESLEMISIRVDSLSGYKLGEADLDILLPKSDYPYMLRSK